MNPERIDATLGATGQACLLSHLGNKHRIAFQLTGTFTATVTFEASVDGSTWVALPVTPIAGGAAVTTATAAGIWQAEHSFPHVRARCSAYSSGSIVVTGYAS